MNQRVKEEREVISNSRTMNRIHKDIERSILESYRMKEVQYGDERVILNKREGRIEHLQGRSEKQYEDSAKILAYSLLGFASLIIVLMIIM